MRKLWKMFEMLKEIYIYAKIDYLFGKSGKLKMICFGYCVGAFNVYI